MITSRKQYASAFDEVIEDILNDKDAMRRLVTFMVHSVQKLHQRIDQTNARLHTLEHTGDTE